MELIGPLPYTMSDKDILRYAGFRSPDMSLSDQEEHIQRLVDACRQEIEQAAEPKAVVREEILRREDGDHLLIGPLKLHSHDLTVNLQGCDRVYLVAATLGNQVDVILRRASALQVAKAVILEACAVAAIEAYLDALNEHLCAGIAPLRTAPRYSPGYGDLSTDCQPELLRVLEAGKYLGISLAGDSVMMIPSKSVTCLMGIREGGTSE